VDTDDRRLSHQRDRTPWSGGNDPWRVGAMAPNHFGVASDALEGRGVVEYVMGTGWCS
jgi:hypothetical protein